MKIWVYRAEVNWCADHEVEVLIKANTLGFLEKIFYKCRRRRIMCEDRRNTCYKKDVCDKCPALEESEWVIEYQKHFNNDPDEGYEEWTSEIVHCKNCGKRPCADKRSNYCPNCGKKMINPR